ncbi:hypothetical protein BpHYR1_030315 [Brachionus plicatilis]|uniref:Uncharacterized protein n=1 Tax=Brachionus plicatilis TaxID=10195 RepID=A0A3M7RR92_BRAPC|nr:hypothetical protein BpHYR1_030315 [Brachionus plicatilis]
MFNFHHKISEQKQFFCSLKKNPVYLLKSIFNGFNSSSGRNVSRAKKMYSIRDFCFKFKLIQSIVFIHTWKPHDANLLHEIIFFRHTEDVERENVSGYDSLKLKKSREARKCQIYNWCYKQLGNLEKKFNLIVSLFQELFRVEICFYEKIETSENACGG